MNFNKRKTYEEYPVEYYIQFLEYIQDKYEGVYWNALPKEMLEFCAGELDHTLRE